MSDEKPPFKPRYQPDNCPHCAYDRRFPETADGVPQMRLGSRPRLECGSGHFEQGREWSWDG